MTKTKEKMDERALLVEVRVADVYLRARSGEPFGSKDDVCALIDKICDHIYRKLTEENWCICQLKTTYSNLTKQITAREEDREPLEARKTLHITKPISHSDNTNNDDVDGGNNNVKRNQGRKHDDIDDHHNDDENNRENGNHTRCHIDNGDDNDDDGGGCIHKQKTKVETMANLRDRVLDLLSGYLRNFKNQILTTEKIEQLMSEKIPFFKDDIFDEADDDVNDKNNHVNVNDHDDNDCHNKRREKAKPRLVFKDDVDDDFEENRSKYEMPMSVFDNDDKEKLENNHNRNDLVRRQDIKFKDNGKGALKDSGIQISHFQDDANEERRYDDRPWYDLEREDCFRDGEFNFEQYQGKSEFQKINDQTRFPKIKDEAEFPSIHFQSEVLDIGQSAHNFLENGRIKEHDKSTGTGSKYCEDTEKTNNLSFINGDNKNGKTAQNFGQTNFEQGISNHTRSQNDDDKGNYDDDSDDKDISNRNTGRKQSHEGDNYHESKNYAGHKSLEIPVSSATKMKTQENIEVHDLQPDLQLKKKEDVDGSGSLQVNVSVQSLKTSETSPKISEFKLSSCDDSDQSRLNLSLSSSSDIFSDWEIVGRCLSSEEYVHKVAEATWGRPGTSFSPAKFVRHLLRLDRPRVGQPTKCRPQEKENPVAKDVLNIEDTTDPNDHEVKEKDCEHTSGAQDAKGKEILEASKCTASESLENENDIRRGESENMEGSVIQKSHTENMDNHPKTDKNMDNMDNILKSDKKTDNKLKSDTKSPNNQEHTSKEKSAVQESAEESDIISKADVEFEDGVKKAKSTEASAWSPGSDSDLIFSRKDQITKSKMNVDRSPKFRLPKTNSNQENKRNSGKSGTHVDGNSVNISTRVLENILNETTVNLYYRETNTNAEDGISLSSSTASNAASSEINLVRPWKKTSNPKLIKRSRGKIPQPKKQDQVEGSPSNSNTPNYGIADGSTCIKPPYSESEHIKCVVPEKEQQDKNKSQILMPERSGFRENHFRNSAASINAESSSQASCTDGREPQQETLSSKTGRSSTTESKEPYQMSLNTRSGQSSPVNGLPPASPRSSKTRARQVSSRKDTGPSAARHGYPAADLDLISGTLSDYIRDVNERESELSSRLSDFQRRNGNGPTLQNLSRNSKESDSQNNKNDQQLSSTLSEDQRHNGSVPTLQNTGTQSKGTNGKVYTKKISSANSDNKRKPTQQFSGSYVDYQKTTAHSSATQKSNARSGRKSKLLKRSRRSVDNTKSLIHNPEIRHKSTKDDPMYYSMINQQTGRMMEQKMSGSFDSKSSNGTASWTSATSAKPSSLRSRRRDKNQEHHQDNYQDHQGSSANDITPHHHHRNHHQNPNQDHNRDHQTQENDAAKQSRIGGVPSYLFEQNVTGGQHHRGVNSSEKEPKGARKVNAKRSSSGSMKRPRNRLFSFLNLFRKPDLM